MLVKNIFRFLLVILITKTAFAQNSNYIYEAGTLWVPGFYNVLNTTDESVYEANTYINAAAALMWDRTANNGNGAWTEPFSWIYLIHYNDNVSAQIRIRQKDYTKSEADQLVLKYADYLGRLPFVLRNGIKLINIMKAEANFGGNNWNNSIDIYEGTLSERLLNEGNMEEMLLHEGTHAALDYLYNEGWIAERDKDMKFVSKYAFDNPNREDISETFAVWLALRNVNNRLSTIDYNKVTEGLANRIAYLNSLDFNIHPIEAKSLSVAQFHTNKFTLYPNPIHNVINLKSIHNDAKAFVIYNALGTKVLEGIIDENKSILFTRFTSGVYFIKLDNKAVVKFIKR